MPFHHVVGTVISVALFVYLLAAMLRPEKFE
jgi:K+-transporting ATPase KdpF subunit